MNEGGAGVNNEAAFKKGDMVVYTSNTGVPDVAVVIKVHYEDNPPFYTIHLTDRDVEKQTDEKNLTYLPLNDNEEEDDDDEDDDLNPPSSSSSSTLRKSNSVSPRRRSASTTELATSHQIGLISLGTVGIAIGLYAIYLWKNNFRK